MMWTVRVMFDCDRVVRLLELFLPVDVAMDLGGGTDVPHFITQLFSFAGISTPANYTESRPSISLTVNRQTEAGFSITCLQQEIDILLHSTLRLGCMAAAVVAYSTLEKVWDKPLPRRDQTVVML
jgi:hypothetical protein